MTLLPAKHLPAGRTLLGLGSIVLSALQEPADVGELTTRVETLAALRGARFTYDASSVAEASCLLFTLGLVELDEDGRIVRCA